MLKKLRSALVLMVVAAIAFAGCGGGDKKTAEPSIPSATFTFKPGGVVTPPEQQIAKASAVRLVIVSADGHSHGVTIGTSAGGTHLAVKPGKRAQATIRGLLSGWRYRLRPDGATKPLFLKVG
jgi:hypothetical protein